MRFAAIALTIGVAGVMLASRVQGVAIVPGAGLPATVIADAEVQPSHEITGSIQSDTREGPKAARLIDLRSGATCKVANPQVADHNFSRVPIVSHCSASPELSKIAYWRSTPSGVLIMADSGGETVLEFAPGDGVLYESIYPSNALITIVPARS
ncbi:hypothetical protein [Consotaella salsifontis]|uniref:Protease inhibitor Inh n=1 Tax=Consotaella salsifontis TaxID=1365950 RepID=A0A1T4NK78_9HYPH|nr:hypothetical protein [Consotaella salsifontis]SJZ79476.1 hypothetical protein SAMN05428963_10359 [Consotaella salsifontis]